MSEPLFKNEHYEAIRRYRTKDNSTYFTVSRDFVHIGLDYTEAVFLQDLINVGSYKCGDGERWFVCTVEEMEQLTTLNKKAQARILNSLQEKHFLKFVKRGVPPTRRIYINHVLIENKIDAYIKANGRVTVRKNGDPRDDDPFNGVDSVPNDGVDSVPNDGVDSVPIYIENKSKKQIDEPGPRKRHRSLRSLAAPAEPGRGTLFDTPDKPAPQLTKWAARLHAALQREYKIDIKCRIEGWAEHFRLLLNSLREEGESRIEAVLTWYEKSPRVWNLESAAAFRRWFLKLEGMMTKRRSPLTSLREGARVRDKETPSVVSRLTAELTWPKGSADQLPALVDDSLVAYRDFRKKVKEARDRLHAHRDEGGRITSKTRELADFVDAMRWTLFASPENFAFEWWSRVNRDVANWEAWSGDLSRYAFTPDSERYQRWGMGEATKHSGSAKLWDRLMKEVL